MAYSPQAAVAEFISRTGQAGELVLSVYTQHDPLHCYFGEDCNPDEYLGYAERFVESMQRESVFLNDSRKDQAWPSLLYELTRRTFGPCQIAEGWVTEEQIKEIALSLLDLGDLLKQATVE